MKILIVYDSFFGNTREIAKAIMKGFDLKENVDICKVENAKPELLTGVELLVVGSPTRGFRPTKEIIAFLKSIPSKGLVNIKVAAFDTRFLLSKIESSTLRFIVKTGGYAAKSIANRLIKKGGKLVISPEGFYVSGEEGPLEKNELVRAKKWSKLMLLKLNN